MNATPMLSCVHYELGENALAAADLEELKDPDLRSSLLTPAAGFETYLQSDADIVELMANAAAKTLAEAGLLGSEIDTVILATDSLSPGRAAHRDVADLLAQLNLSRAVAFTVGLMDCATALLAVSMAAAMVRTGEAGKVLVLSADLADRAAPGGRVVAGGAAIASDAAASALVSTAGSGRPVLAGARHFNPPYRGTAAGMLRPAEQLTARVLAHRELAARLAAMHPYRISELSAVYASNFAQTVIGLYLRDLGFDAAQMRPDNVRRIGHCLGSDPLINLADDDGAGPCMLLGSGIDHLAAVLLGEAVA